MSGHVEDDKDDEIVREQTAIGIFSGDCEGLDVDRAVAELRRAGCRVLRLADELKAKLEIPGDDFIQIYFKSSNAEVDEIWERLDCIVEPCGGFVDSVGEVQAGHKPFEDIFGTDAA